MTGRKEQPTSFDVARAAMKSRKPTLAGSRRLSARRTDRVPRGLRDRTGAADPTQPCAMMDRGASRGDAQRMLNRCVRDCLDEVISSAERRHGLRVTKAGI